MVFCGEKVFLRISSGQSLSRVQLFATPWITAYQASLSITNSQSSLRSRPLSPWCHPTISSLSSPSPPAPNPSQHQGLFQWVTSSHGVAEVLEFQLQHHSLQRNPRADLQNGLVGSCSPRDSQESSPTPQFKSMNSSVLSLWQSTPVLLPGKSHGQGQRSLVGLLCPWGHKESDTTEKLHFHSKNF